MTTKNEVTIIETPAVKSELINQLAQFMSPEELLALRTEVSEASARLGDMSDRISIDTDTKQFVLPDGQMLGQLDCVIVDFASANMFWQKSYSPGDSAPPECFAFGKNPATLVPSPNATNPQSEDACASCWANQFKTSSNGKGKKCSNNRMLAILLLNDPFTTYVVKVSPTALQAFDKYVMWIGQRTGLPIRFTPTRISLDASSKFASLRFENSDLTLTSDFLSAIAKSYPTAMTRLLKEPEPREEEQVKPQQQAPMKNRFGKK